MIQQTVKTLVTVFLVLLVGSLVASLQVVEGAELLEWTIDDLVRLAAFGVAALLLFDLGWRLGDQKDRPVLDSYGLSYLVMLLLSAIAVYLLYRGVKVVLRPQWLDTLDLIFALVMVGFAGAVLWRLYADFEEIVESVQRAKSDRREVRSSATSRADSEPKDTAPEPNVQRTEVNTPPNKEGGQFCTSCGEQLQAGHRFCGSCGEPVSSSDTQHGQS